MEEISDTIYETTGTAKAICPHPLTANRFLGNLYTTTVADNTFITDSLVLPAVDTPSHEPDRRFSHRTDHPFQGEINDS